MNAPNHAGNHRNIRKNFAELDTKIASKSFFLAEK